MVNYTGNATGNIPLFEDVIKNISLTGGSLENNIILFLAIILASFLTALITNFFINKYVRKITSMTKSEIDDKLINVINKPIYYVILIIGLQFALTIFLEPGNVVFKLTSAALIAILSLVTADIIIILLNDLGKRLASKTETSLDDEAIPFLSKLLRVAVYFLGVMIILDIFGIEITPLVASLGIAGFAIGFAAKDTISNLLAGFFILTDRPFAKGDRIKIGSNTGEVVDVGLRSTKIKTLENTYVIIPNGEIVSTDVTNYALPDMQLKVKLTFGVAYGSDAEAVKKVILDIAGESKYVMDDPAPSIYFMEFADSSINFLLIFWVHTFKKKLRAIDDINERVYNKFAEEGIDIPFPCRTVYISK